MARDATERKLAEQDLRESEERYRRLVELNPDAIVVVSEGQIVFANPAEATLMGASSPEELIGKSATDLLHPEDRTTVEERLRRIDEEGEASQVSEGKIVRLDGQVRDIEAVGASIIYQGKKAVQIIARDITDRKRAEEAERRWTKETLVVAEIGRIISSSLDIEQLYEPFADQVGTLVPFDQIVINFVDQESDRFTNLYVSGSDVLNRRPGDWMPIAGAQVEAVIRSATSHLIQTDDRDELAGQFPGLVALFDGGLRSFLSVPLLSEDRVIGSLALRSRDSDAYSNADIKIVESVANQIAGAVANAQLFEKSRQAEAEALRRSEELTALFEIASILGAPGDFQGKVESVTQNILEIAESDSVFLRVPNSEENGFELLAGASKADSQYVPPKLRPFGQGVINAVFQSGEAVIINDYPANHRAQERFVAQGFKSVFFMPVKAGAQTFGVFTVGSLQAGHFTPDRVRLLTAIADGLATMLQNANLAEDLRASSEEMAVVDEIAQILTSTLDINQVYDRFATEVKKLVEFDRLAVHVIDQPKGTYIVRYLAGLEVPTRPVKTDRSLEGTFAEQLLQTHQTLISPHLASGDLLEVGLKSGMSIPLISSGRIVASLSVLSLQVNAYGTREQRIMERLASQIAPAIENAQFYYDVNKSKTEIERLSDFNNRVLASTPTALAVLKGSERTVVSVNRAFRQAFGFSNDVIEGRPISEVLPLGNIEEIIQEVLLSEGNEAQNEMRYTTPEGRERWIVVSATPLRAEAEAEAETEAEGEAEALLILNDITEQKQHQEKLQETARLASIGELAAGVAHEVNNPLAVVLGFSQLVLDQDLPSSTKEDVVRIYEHAQRASKIMENLLAFARKYAPERRYIDVTTAVANAIALKAHEFSVSNVDIIFDPSPDIPHTMADEHQLQQVFFNIISNAGEAMVEAHGMGTLHISAMQVGTKLRLSFTDDGPGISPENITKVFDPFFTTKEVGKGTGLGLSICYGIIREHGGDIWAESREGEGTTTHVELPIVSSNTIIEGQALETPAVPPLRQHYLVVDDESGLRDLLQRGLSAGGHTVDLSPDGQAAWDMIQKYRYDCIITGLKMPGISGQQLYHLVKESEPELAGKIAFITGDTASSEAAKFLEATGNLVLRKPFDLEELVRQIQDLATPDN